MQVKVIDRNVLVQSAASQSAVRQQGVREASRGGSFAEILGQVEKKISFSKHAEERLQSSGEVMDTSRLAQLENAVDVAFAKGARSTLVLMKGLAFVVSPQTRTVITVMREDRMKENVFTSIDSAVVVDK